MVGNGFKAGLEVDSGAEFHDWTSDGSFGGKSWYLGLRHRSGAQGTSRKRSSGLALEMGVKDCLTIISRPGSPSCKGSLFSEMFERKEGPRLF